MSLSPKKGCVAVLILGVYTHSFSEVKYNIFPITIVGLSVLQFDTVILSCQLVILLQKEMCNKLST